MTGYVTIGGAQHRRVTGITADVSWLGDPPTFEQSRRYEKIRSGRIAAAEWIERSALEAESRRLMLDIAASESPVRRKRLVQKLQAVNARIAAL